MKYIHYPPSLPFLHFYMLIAVSNYYHSNPRTYMTIPTIYCLLYASIFIATHIQICTWASLRATRMSYAGCQYQYPRTLSFDIKNNKLWLFEICEALNYIHSNWRTYVTISTASRVLYVSIFIATHVQICMQVSLIETRMSYAGCQYQ